MYICHYQVEESQRVSGRNERLGIEQW